MSRILFISFIPTHPPVAGNSVRILKQVELLRELGHEVHFAYLHDGHSGDLPVMREHWGERLTVLPYRNPARPPLNFKDRAWMSVRRRLHLPVKTRPKESYGIDDWYDDRLTSPLLEVVKRVAPDSVVVEYVFFSKILESLPDHVLKVIDTHDVFADRSRRADSRWFSTTRDEEARGLNRANTVFAIQEEEEKHFCRICAADVTTVGHPIQIVELTGKMDSNATTIGYLGSRNIDNVNAVRWFFEQVYPLLKESGRNVSFLLVGSVCNHLDDLPAEVECISFAENLDEVYSKMDIVINPAQKGTGLKIKTVEALGYGRPLITSPVGAEGLVEQAGKAFELADSPQDFSEKILELAGDLDRRKALGAGAHKFCREYNQQIRQALAEVFK